MTGDEMVALTKRQSISHGDGRVVLAIQEQAAVPARLVFAPAYS